MNCGIVTPYPRAKGEKTEERKTINNLVDSDLGGQVRQQTSPVSLNLYVKKSPVRDP